MIDPRLQSLEDYGGPTLTMALSLGSPAVDAGGPPYSALDQRGLSRVGGGETDLGSYESGNGAGYAVWVVEQIPNGLSSLFDEDANFTPVDFFRARSHRPVRKVRDDLGQLGPEL